MTKSHLRIFITALMTGIAVMLSPHAEAYAQIAHIDFEITDGSDIGIVRHQSVKMETTAPVAPTPAPPYAVSAVHVKCQSIQATLSLVIRKDLQKTYCVFRE